MTDIRLHAPFNAVTGVDYQGGNITRLLIAEGSNAYSERGWAGFAQWRTIGRTVRRGEHGTPCLTVVNVVDKKTGRDKRSARGFRVFHFDQTEELAPNEASNGHAPDIDLVNGY